MLTADQLDANLAAHRERWGFAPAVATADAQVRVERHGGPWPRVTLRTSDGRWLRVHSDRAPLAEAARWLADEPITASLVCVLGAGCGYVLDVLAERAPSTTKVLVCEPEPAFVRLCLERRDWRALIDAGRLMVVAGPDYAGRTEAWRLVTPDAADPLVLCHPMIAEHRVAATREAADVVRQAVTGARANEEARERFAGRYLLNTLRNLPAILEGTDVRMLRGRGAGRPAIVAGAGPSLNRNLAELAQVDGWRERALYIAVDTALKPSLGAGLSPHYVVAVDPGATNARMLTGLPPTIDTTLVAEASIDARSFAAFRQRVHLFKVSDTHQPWPWLNTHGLDVGKLRAWGSVLTTAFDFALTLGCDPIVFIGADLAYTNGQPHCRQTVYEEEWAAAMAHGATVETVWRYQLPETIPITDLHGATTQSSPALIAFRDWLVTHIAAEPTRRVVNATGAGILAGPRLARGTLTTELSGLDGHAPRTHVPRTAASIAHPSRHAIVEAIGDAAAALVAGRAGAAGSSPLQDWIAFARGRVTEADLLAALSEMLTSVAVSRQPSWPVTRRRCQSQRRADP